RYFVDYRIQLGAQRKKDIVTTLIDSGNHGIFIEKKRKTSGAVLNIPGSENKKAYLEAYFDFLNHTKQTARGGSRTLNLYPFEYFYNSTPNYTGYAVSEDLFHSDEALMNAYFNGLYSERWLLNPTPDQLVNRLDWYINKWTGHGKLFTNNVKAVTPHSQENVFDLAINLAVMGKNSRFRFFDDNSDFRYELGGWKNPTYWANLADLKLGEPYSNARREGYVYTRQFEFCEVEVDVSNRTGIIRWLKNDGSLLEQWPTDFVKNDNAQLSAITWPDMPQQMDGWQGDTIPQFASTTTYYVINIPPEMESIPVLTAIPQNPNAEIEQHSATSLLGTTEERTTTFTVTSEDNLSVIEYNVTFSSAQNIQPNGGEPFISEVVSNNKSWMSFVEVKNPSSLALDFSAYLFLKSNSTNDPARALQELIPDNPTADDYYSRYNAYIPGYKFHDDSTEWFANQGKVVPDDNVNPLVAEGDVFVFGSCAYDRSVNLTAQNYPDKLWETPGPINIPNDNNVSLWETFSMVKRNAEALFIFKIISDDVINGSKAIGDPGDYELVDILANATLNGSWNIAGDSIVFNTRVDLRRKPHIQAGISTAGDGFGTTAENSDWIVLLEENMTDLGRHNMDSITGFISTVTSSVYLVSAGYLSPQSIQGDLSATTVSQFSGNIQKADSSQTLTMISNNDGSILSPSDIVSEGDTLQVLASKGAQTSYILIDKPVSSDALLTSAALSINVNNQLGTIEGMFFGDTLRDVVEMVSLPDFATMKVLDEDGVLVPMRQLNMMGEYNETSVTDHIWFEVTAQDNSTRISYLLLPAIPANGVLIFSDVYNINHDSLTISGLINVTGTALIYNSIQTIDSAAIQVVNADSTERISVVVDSDCLLKVIAKDGTFQYYELVSDDETRPDKKTVFFSIHEENMGNPITNISVSLGDHELFTGNNGVAAFKVNKGEYHYTISHADYFTYNSSFELRKDTTIHISLLAKTADIKFRVYSENTPVNNVVIRIDGDSLSTSQTGIAIFKDLTRFEAYEWSASKEGFEGISGMINLKNDSTVNVNMTLTSISEDYGFKSLKLYPNPAHSIVHIESDSKLQRIQICDLRGALLKNYLVNNTQLTIDMSCYPNGLYIIKVDRDGQITENFKLIKEK
ncbi:MAG: T9SS type A sorting domain-containing protein, partial [Bacteroidetes bacterium]|nr:T9SS type A sorting domain-containing protein [Bacteroidota bacterium]